MVSAKHIVVVDDDGDVRDVVAALLENKGYRVSLASDGVELRGLLARSDLVDAIVLDALMPGEASAALALHAKRLRVPVVMISGSPKAMQFAQEHGLQLLWKPFGQPQLLEALDRAFDSGEFGQRDEEED